MARSGYQSQNKDWGEMYEHELDACAAELDAVIDGLIATDNALTAERDEWKRRLDAVVKDLEPKQGPPNPTNPTAVDVAIWRESRSIHRRIIAIAEGRDNA